MPFADRIDALWALLGLLTLGTLFAAAWLWRTRPWRGPRPRYPVVLIHGILGFDEIGLGTHRHNYFRGIAEHLQSLGIEVYRPRLPALGTLTERAEALAAVLRAIPARKLNLIAHSMGGLDARWAISRLGCDRRVASLVTIGTPHHGTPLADLGSALLGETFGLGALLTRVGLSLDAIHDLTTAKMAQFEREVPDARSVRYGCVLATAKPQGQPVHPLLRPSRAYLSQRHGPNDGLVPLESQRHGQVLDEIQADHWAQIGWSNGFDAPAFYERLVRRLRRMGL